MTASNPPPGGGQAAAVDPSMEDILASIRRILSEDEAETTTATEPQHAAREDVLALDASMLVDEPAPLPAAVRQPVIVAPPPPQPVPLPLPPPTPPAPVPRAAPPEAMSAPELPPEQPPPMDINPEPKALIGAEAAAATTSSVGSLLRTLASERQQMSVYRGGPSIEDVVREEIRPLLKQWLDVNLPPLVEQLVRTEIERLVGGSKS